MRLWTFHTPDFSLTSGAIDLDHSYDVSYVPGLRERYEDLAHYLGLDRYEIIWCHVRDDIIRDAYVDRVEYILEVPDYQILRIVDSYIWNKIIGLDAYPRSKWQTEAPEGITSEYFQKKVDEYHDQLPPPGGWWPQLFLTDTTAEGACVLLRHPIPESWINRKKGSERFNK